MKRLKIERQGPERTHHRSSRGNTQRDVQARENLLYLRPQFNRKPAKEPSLLDLPIYANAVNNLLAHGHRRAVIRKAFRDLLDVYELLGNEKKPRSTRGLKTKLYGGINR